MTNNLGTAYLAPEGFEDQLSKELKGVVAKYGRLFLTHEKPQEVFWVQNIWYEPFIESFESISAGAAILKHIQRNWVHCPFQEIRRAKLIEEKLPYLSKKPIKFPTQAPQSPLGSWMLLDKHTLLASATCSSPFPNGQPLFDESRVGPPSRAYLKLWEALTLLGNFPLPGQKCLEVGASPGGWTWVLANLGVDVLSVDRSELAPQVASLPGVKFKMGNAFSMTPDIVGEVDWIFSDVACYPEKLYDWVQLWLKSGQCKHFVTTLKFLGDPSYEIAHAFAEIPGSRVVHLGYNKHELTWIL